MVNLPAIGEFGWGQKILDAFHALFDEIKARPVQVFDVRTYNPESLGFRRYDGSVIQQALDDAAEAGGGVVYIPSATAWEISETLVIRSGVTIEGGHGGRQVSTRWPELWWTGEEGGVMFETDPDWNPGGFGTPRLYAIQFKRLYMRRGSGHPHWPSTLVRFNDRMDSGTSFEDVWLAGARDHLVEFLHGGINIHFKSGCRFDFHHGYGIYWVVSHSTDNMSIDGFEYDNNTGEESGGGLLHIDASTGGANRVGFFSLKNAKLEVNRPIPLGEAVIKVSTNPDSPTKHQVDLNLENLWIAPASGIDPLGLLVEPATDFIRVRIASGATNWRVEGIPSYRPTRFGSGNTHIDTVIAPQTRTTRATGGEGSAKYVNRMLVGDEELVGHRYQFGKFASPWLLGSILPDDWDVPANLYEGMVLLDPASIGSSALVIHVATDDGTIGTVQGAPTATGTQGSYTATFSSLDGFSIGQRVRIGGSGNYRITEINGATGEVTFSGTLSSSVTNAPVTYRTPPFASYQLPQLD